MFGMDKVIGKVILVIILILVLLGGMFLVIIEGTLDILQKVIDFGMESATASLNTALSWLGVSTVEKSLPRFVIKEEMVEQLKSQLNDQQINTKTNGMTDVVLRKMLLTYVTTTSLNDTVCMVELTPEAIIEDFKKKNPAYKEQNLSIDDVKNLCGSLYKKDNSNNIWTMEDNPGYDLYYNSEHFFYFKDTQKEFGDDSEKWFLAIMGSIAIKTKDGQAFEYRTAEEFVEVKNNWEDALVNKGGDSEFWKYATKATNHETSYEALKKSYTRDSALSTKLKVYNIVCKEDSYYYNFKNNNSDRNIDVESPADRSTKTGEDRYTFGRKGEGCTYEAQETEIDLDTQVDLTQNSVQIELMINFLDLTGSDEFLETFIDYAIEESDASVTAYSLEDEEIQYDKTTYNIGSDFIIEAYDMYDFGVQSGTVPTATGIWNEIKSTAGSVLQELMETNKVDFLGQIREFVEQLNNSDRTSVALDFDLNNDNFKAYYDIIFNRSYTGGNWPTDGKVTSIENYKDIDFGGGGEYFVSPLHTYLKCAYDPADDFRLGTISVTEVIRHREVTNHWQLVLASVDTWYKKVNYDIPDPKTLYQTEENDLVTKSEYDNYDESKANNPTEKVDEQIEDKYIYDKLVEQVRGEIPGLVGNYNEQTNNDILADTIIGSDIGVGNVSQFGNRNINGLAEIAKIDGGEKNSSTGALSGSDYVYVKYKKTNIKNYKTSKRKKQIIEDSNVEETSSTNDTEAKIDRFLALLRNATGTIPNPLHDGVFTGVNDNPSIVVRYKDIYGGTAPVGDFLLNNGALMLFNLLESYDNTQNLVNVFKYMAYKYSGTDYGITDISQLINLFSLPGGFPSIGSGFWWPIGSATTRNEEGVTYADGTPVASDIGETIREGAWRVTEHQGLDISGGSCTRGTNIIAAKDGTVIEAVDGYGDGYYGFSPGYGNHVFILHDDGYVTRYAHLLQGTVKVSNEQRVKQGQVIGGMGTSGSSTGVHLHFEVRDPLGNVLNPLEYASPTNPRPQMAAGGLTQEAYAMLLYFEGGTQYMTATGDYRIFNNGVDKNFEITCGIAVGYQVPYQSYYPSLIPNPQVGQIVTKDVYNQIFAKVCKQKYKYVDTACAKYGVTLTNNQRDAVFMFIYNMGGDQQYIANTAISRYKTGGAESYYNYTKECSLEIVYLRRAKEYELFKNGTYIK